MNSTTNRLFNFIFINFGLMFLSLAVVLFLTPCNLSTGGSSGIANMLHYYFSDIKIGTFILIVNIPLFLMGAFTFGRAYMINTFYGIVAMSYMCNLFGSMDVGLTNYIKSISSNSMIISSIAGGVLVGLGAGLAVAFGGNSGGTTIPAQVMNHKFKISIGVSMIIIDFTVVAVGGFLFGITSMMYAVMSLVISGKVVDIIVDYINSNSKIKKLRGISS